MGETLLAVLRDLDDRLHKASSDLDDKAQRAAALHNTTEYSRIDGKRQGIELARSYLDEVIRDAH